MALVTQADFAKSHGVSRKTATIWKAKGYLVLKGDKVDADASDRRLKDLSLGRFTTKGQGNSQGNTKAKPPPRTPASHAKIAEAATRKVNGADAGEPEDDPDADDAAVLPAEFAQNILDGKFAKLHQAERVKENALAGKHMLDLVKKAGSQIDLTDAEEVFFEQARANRDAWTTWPSRFGPLLAADLGVPANVVTERLNEYVQQYLAELGDHVPEFGGEGSET